MWPKYFDRFGFVSDRAELDKFWSIRAESQNLELTNAPTIDPSVEPEQCGLAVTHYGENGRVKHQPQYFFRKDGKSFAAIFIR
jgi:hypothetical protein